MPCSNTVHTITSRKGLTEPGARMVASKSQSSSCLTLGQVINTGAGPHVTCQIGSRHVNTGTQACVASAPLPC